MATDEPRPPRPTNDEMLAALKVLEWLKTLKIEAYSADQVRDLLKTTISVAAVR